MKEKPVLGTVLEGESYVGKSTTLETVSALKEMREQGIIIIPEYSVIGRLPNFPRETVTDIKKATQKMIELEKRRTDKLVDDIAHHSTQWVLFDRGPVSCIAFEHAAEKFGYKGARYGLQKPFKEKFWRRISSFLRVCFT